ncbi:MAG: LysR family transcriptional regulator [Myxococcota bacterium]
MSDDFLETALAQFAAVAEHGSFSAAAKALHVSQPTLSVAVRKLEERLRTQLFHRDSRGVTLTPAGTLLVQRVRQATQVLRAARDEIAALADEPRGEFVLGCHESLGTYLLPGFMGRFLEQYPEITLSLHNANSKDVEAAILERRIDLGLVVNPGMHPDTVVRELFRDAVTFVVARRLARKSADTLFDRYPILHVPSLRQTQAILDAMQPRPLRTLACSSLELVKSLVLDGTGVGVLPYRVASHGVAKGRLEVLAGELPRYDDRIALVWRADVPMTVGLRTLLDALLEHGASMEALPEVLR